MRKIKSFVSMLKRFEKEHGSGGEKLSLESLMPAQLVHVFLLAVKMDEISILVNQLHEEFKKQKKEVNELRELYNSFNNRA